MINITKQAGLILLLLFSMVIAGCGGNDSDGLPSQKVTDSTEVTDNGSDDSVLAVSPGAPTLAAGTTLQLQVTYTDEDGKAQDVAEEAQYFSDDQSVVKVNKSGLLQGIAEGSAVITILYQGVSKEIQVQVSSPEVSGLEVIPGSSSSAAGILVYFTANAIYTDGSKKEVTLEATWSSKNTAQATIESPGVINPVAKGEAEIVVEYNGQSASAMLTVTDATITSIVVTPKDIHLPNGYTEQLVATAQLSDGSTQDVSQQVTWESDDTSVATVDDTGLVTSVADSGDATITATINDQTDTVTVTASNAEVKQLTVSPTNLNLPKGASKQFKAEAVFSDDTTKDVTNDVQWSSSSADVTISDKGLAQAVSIGESTITASLGGKESTAQVTVSDAVITSVIVVTEPNPVQLAKGEKATVTVKANYSDGQSIDVTEQATLTTQNVDVATIVEGNAIYAAGEGSTTVTARYNSLDSAPIEVTVTSATLTGINVEPASLSLAKGTQGKLNATGTYSDDSEKDISNQVNWTTDDSNVASVDPTGLVTANDLGSASIKASFAGVESSGVGVTVTDATVMEDGLTIEPASLTLAKGDTGSLSATAKFTDGPPQSVTNSTTWTTSDSAVATVTSRGVVQAVQEGEATITGKYQGEEATATVTVGPKRADLLHLNAVRTADLDILGLIQLEIGAGDSIFAIRSTVTYSDGTTRILEPNEPQYMTDNNQLIDIDALGEVRLASADVLESANVTASFESLVSDNQINVACLTRVTLLGIIQLGLACDIDDTQANPDYVAP